MFDQRLLVFPTVLAGTLLLTASGVFAQSPFACTGEAYIVQDSAAAGIDGQLTQIDQSVSPFAFMPVGAPQTEYNNIGFRRQDGFLYGVELTPSGNNGLIRVRNDGTVESLQPVTGTCSGGLAFPSNVRFDAGDVSSDGTLLFVNQTGAGRLWILDITADPPALLHCPVLSPNAPPNTNRVNDWAYNDADGNLYGGDRDDLEVARLGLAAYLAAPGASITRTDFAITGALDGVGAFGGAWFNALDSLFLYRNGDATANSGRIFEITDVTGATPTMTISASQSGPGSSRNDGAACAQDRVGAAKSMATSDGSMFPATITIDYVFENLSATDALTAPSAVDDLTAVFGSHGTDWTFGSISSSPASLANPSFDGHMDRELVDTTQGLASSTSGSITVTLTLLSNAGDDDMDGSFCNQVVFTGSLNGVMFGDTSTDGTDPDPDSNGVPNERQQACISQVPVELLSFSIE